MSETADNGTLHLLGWLTLVAVTLALLPLGDAQRRMLRDGRLRSDALPRAATYRDAALQWLVLGSLALWAASAGSRR